MRKKITIPELPIKPKLRPWIVILLAIGLYANTLTHDFALDDAIVIHDNMFTTEGFSGWGGILSHDTFYGFFKEEGKAGLVSGGRYRPLSMLMFAAVYQFFGSTPAVFHLLNVLLYALCCLILYLSLSHYLPLIMGKKSSAWVAFLSALIFTAHPVHTEVVANIKGADEILALGFGLLSWQFMLRKGKWSGPLAGIAFFLALLAKENAVTLIAILPLAEWLRKDFRWGHLSRWWPIGAAFILYLIIRFSVLGTDVAGEPPRELMNNPFLKVEDNQYIPLDASEKSATIMYTLGEYIRLLVYPHPLVHDYYPRHIPIMNWSDPAVLFSMAGYIVLLLLALFGLWKKRLWGFAIAWYLVTLSIFSNIVFPVGTNMSERFLFMPSVGFCLAVGWILMQLTKSVRSQLPALILGGIVVLAFSVKTITRNPVWKDNFTLFTTDVKLAPGSAKLQNATGGVLLEKANNVADDSRKKELAKEAEKHLKKALEIHPNYKNAALLLGNSYFYRQEFEVAVTYYHKALKVDPDYSDALKNLHTAYREGGRYYGEQLNNLEKSIAWLEAATQNKADDAEAWRLLGVAYGYRGRS